MKKATWLQGYGRHSEQEATKIGKDDLKSINDYIGNKKYLFGEQICDVDATIFGFMCQFLFHDRGPLNKFLMSKLKYMIIFQVF